MALAALPLGSQVPALTPPSRPRATLQRLAGYRRALRGRVGQTWCLRGLRGVRIVRVLLRGVAALFARPTLNRPIVVRRTREIRSRMDSTGANPHRNSFGARIAQGASLLAIWVLALDLRDHDSPRALIASVLVAAIAGAAGGAAYHRTDAWRHGSGRWTRAAAHATVLLTAGVVAAALYLLGFRLVPQLMK